MASPMQEKKTRSPLSSLLTWRDEESQAAQEVTSCHHLDDQPGDALQQPPRRPLLCDRMLPLVCQLPEDLEALQHVSLPLQPACPGQRGRQGGAAAALDLLGLK